MAGLYSASAEPGFRAAEPENFQSWKCGARVPRRGARAPQKRNAGPILGERLGLVTLLFSGKTSILLSLEDVASRRRAVAALAASHRDSPRAASGERAVGPICPHAMLVQSSCSAAGRPGSLRAGYTEAQRWPSSAVAGATEHTRRISALTFEKFRADCVIRTHSSLMLMKYGAGTPRAASRGSC